MNQITQFKDLGIKAEKKQQFTGTKIALEYIVGQDIEIHDYEIKDSKFKDKGNGKRLDMQITINGIRHVTWTGSVILMDMIQQIPKEAFPVATKIKKENRGYEFT